MDLDIFGTADLDEATRLDIVRKELLNLTTSYSDEADVFTEMIQNSIDAIYSRAAKEPNYEGNLTVVVGRRKSNAHYIYVQDDGIGMPADVLQKIFIPSFSFGKTQGKTIGYKGVGLSYVVAVSTHLAITTTQGGVSESRTINHTHEWVTDSERPQPVVSASFNAPDLVKELADGIGENGTGTFFAFHPGSDPKTLDNIVLVKPNPSDELQHWAAFLAARTAIGVTIPQGEEPPVKMKVRIIFDRGAEQAEATYQRSRYNLAGGTIGYPFPEAVLKVGVDTETIDKTPDAQKIVKHLRKHQAVFREWKAQELIDDIDSLDEEERALLSSHLVWVRGHLSYSTEVLKKIRDLMGTRAAVVRYGARLAVDGAPQGRPLELALTSDQGLDRQSHIVLGFSELGLDTGRKIVADERMARAINKVTQRVVTRLKDYRPYLKVKDKAPVASDLSQWVSDINSRAGTSSIPELFKALGAVPPARVDPDNEQEVIALWTALVTAGVFSGFSMRALSGFKRYDALVNIEQEALEDSGYLAAIDASSLPKNDAVLEFKWRFDSLIDDFENKLKIPSEIDLVVCWDCPNLNLRIGSLDPTYGEWSHSRPHRAVSYVWSDDAGNNPIPVISLRNAVLEVMAELNVSNGSLQLEALQASDKEKLI